MHKKEIKKRFDASVKSSLKNYKMGITNREWCIAQIAVINALAFRLQLKYPHWPSMPEDYENKNSR